MGTNRMHQVLLQLQILVTLIAFLASGRNRHGHSYNEKRPSHSQDHVMQYIVQLGISEEDVCALGQLVVTSLTSVHSAPPQICLKEAADFLQPYSTVFGGMEKCREKLEEICAVSSISRSNVLLVLGILLLS